MKKIKVLLGVLLTSLVIGCGSASNNDQGVSFTLVGFFQDSNGEVGLSYLIAGLSDVAGEGGGGDGGDLTAYVGLQNNLNGQFVRVQRVSYSYIVPGAAVQPPDTSVPVAGVLAPIDSDDSSLPPTINPDNDGTPSTLFTQIPVLPAQVRAWLNLNRGSLPEAPFDIEVIATAKGVTSAGDTLETNSAALLIRVTPDNIIQPGTGGEGEEQAP